MNLCHRVRRDGLGELTLWEGDREAGGPRVKAVSTRRVGERSGVGAIMLIVGRACGGSWTDLVFKEARLTDVRIFSGRQCSNVII